MNGILLNLIEIWFFSTVLVNYILMKFFVAYASFMNIVKEKIYMNKFVIKFLLDKISLIYKNLLKNF